MAIATIFQGAGTPATGRTVAFSLPDIEYGGRAVVFELLGHRRIIDTARSGTQVELVFSADETATMPLGTHRATLSVDVGGGHCVGFALVPVKVTDVFDDAGVAGSVATHDAAVASIGLKVSTAELQAALEAVEAPGADATQKTLRQTLAALIEALKGIGGATALLILAGCGIAVADTLTPWEEMPPDSPVNAELVGALTGNGIELVGGELSVSADAIGAEVERKMAEHGMPGPLYEDCDFWEFEQTLSGSLPWGTEPGLYRAILEQVGEDTWQGAEDRYGRTITLAYGQSPPWNTWVLTDVLGRSTEISSLEGRDATYCLAMVQYQGGGIDPFELMLNRVLRREAGYPRVASTNDLAGMVSAGAFEEYAATNRVALAAKADAVRVGRLPDLSAWHYLYNQYGYHSEYDLPWVEEEGAWVYGSDTFTNVLFYRDGLWHDVHGRPGNIVTDTVEAAESVLDLPGYQGNFWRGTVPTNYPAAYMDDIPDIDLSFTNDITWTGSDATLGTLELTGTEFPTGSLVPGRPRATSHSWTLYSGYYKNETTTNGVVASSRRVFFPDPQADGSSDRLALESAVDAVAVAATNHANGAVADLKSQVETGWWTEWDIDVTFSGPFADYGDWRIRRVDDKWNLEVRIDHPDEEWVVENTSDAGESATRLEWDDFVDQSIVRVTATRRRIAGPAGDYVLQSKKELHADGWTNIVWVNVYSNGWVFLRAYTNELSEAY